MVGFVNVGPNRTGRLAELLGDTLGKGLGNFSNSYFANKAMEGVINDESLQDKPQHEKLGKLQAALAPFGELGANMFNQRLQLEQLRQKEEKDLTDKKKEKAINIAVNKKLKGEELTPEEEAIIPAALNVSTQKAINSGNKTSPESTFSKELQKNAAKNYSSSIEDVAKIDSSLASLDRIDKLKKEVGGILGLAKGAIGVGEATNEINALGLSAIEPVLKIFNPVGAIPTQKIELIKDKFAIKATDLESTIDGKLKALRLILDQAKKRANDRIALYENYKGIPPQQLVNDFDRESQQYLDAINDLPIQKTKFDLSNKEHKKKREHILNSVGGDRNKANQILAQEFEI